MGALVTARAAQPGGGGTARREGWRERMLQFGLNPKIVVVCTNLRKNLYIKMDKICGRKRSKDERLWLERGWWESSSAKTKRAQDDSVCAWELIARVAGCFTQQLEGPNLCGLKFLAQPTYSQASSTGLAIGYMTCEQSPYRDEFILNYLPIYLSIYLSIYLLLFI